MSDDERQYDDAQPLHGVVLCCTSIVQEQNHHLAEIGRQMGASLRYELTLDVTHLIVGKINTEKYKYIARARPEVKVVLPEWLEAVRQSWMDGEGIDISALEKKFRCPTMHGLQICVTGFDTMQERDEIRGLVTDNGAQYHGDLTKAVTHLIAAKPQGKKYDYAGAWGIRIVSIEWLWDSLKRGMVLDEECFNPLAPSEERGRGALQSLSLPSKRKHALSNDDPQNNDRRKLRRTASTKLESQNEDLWADIGTGEKKAVSRESQEWSENTKAQTNHPSSASNAARKETHMQQSPGGSTGAVKTVNADAKLFDGFSMCIIGFDSRRGSILGKHLAASGASVYRGVDFEQLALTSSSNLNKGEDTTYLVVAPYNLAEAEQSIAINFKGMYDVVSEMWIEKCLHRKAIVDRFHPSCKPFRLHPVPGFDKLRICSSGFSSIDLMHFAKGVRLLGAEFDERLTANTAVLVCAEGTVNPEKLRYASQHQISIVSTDWFWDSVQSGKKQSIQQYSIDRHVGSSAANDVYLRRPFGNTQRNDKGDIRQHNRTVNTAKSDIKYTEAETYHSAVTLFINCDETPRGDGLKVKPLQELPANSNSQEQRQRDADRSSINPLAQKKRLTSSDTMFEMQQDENGEVACLGISRMSGVATSASSVNDSAPRRSGQQTSGNFQTAIAHLMHNKTAARDIETTHGSLSAADRTSRALGRARSNPSSLAQGNSPKTSSTFTISTSEQITIGEASFPNERQHESSRIPWEEEEQAVSGSKEQFSVRPSQALEYEDPESLAARESLSKGHKTRKKAQKRQANDAGQVVEATGVKDLQALSNEEQVSTRTRSIRRRPF